MNSETRRPHHTSEGTYLTNLGALCPAQRLARIVPPGANPVEFDGILPTHVGLEPVTQTISFTQIFPTLARSDEILNLLAAEKYPPQAPKR